MQAVKSVGYTRKTLAAAGIGMFIAFLFLTPLTSFAAGSVTLSTDKTTYAVDATITVNGTVTPAPGISGTSVAVTILTPSGTTADANQFAVNPSTGAYGGTFVTGGPTYSPQGTYTISANYNGATASQTFTYGNGSSSVTSSQTGGATTTTIVEQTTVTQVVSSVTTVVSSAVTTVSAVAQTTTTVVNAVTTTISSSVAGSDSTALAIGAVGVIIAIIAAVLAVLAMRKK
jgi:hypothetical protein